MLNSTLKSLLTVALVGMAGSAMAADNAPVFDWANYLQSSGGTIMESIAAGKNGSSYWMGAATTNGDAVTLNGEALFTGETKVGTASTNNFVLFKAAADGSMMWNIHSTSGDFTPTKMAAVVESGDNVYFATTVRQYTADVKSNLVDSKGTVTEFGDPVANVADRYYTGIVVSATKDGVINWITTINGPEGEKDVLATQGLAVAEDGTIVLVGQASKALTIGDATLTPAAEKQAYVMLLDKDGKYVSHFMPTGTTLGASSFTYAYAEGDDIYFAGKVEPDAEALTLTFGGKEFTTGTTHSAFAAKASATSLKDGKFDWLTCFVTDPMADGKYTFIDGKTIPGVDCVWFTAQFKGSITMNGKTVASTQSAQNEGLLIKMTAEGAFVNGTVSRVDFTDAYICGYEGVLQTQADKAYVYGYGMNAEVGIFLREYDAETLAPNKDADWSLASFNGMPTGNIYAYNKEEGTLFAYTRPNKPVSAMGVEQTQTITNWTSFCGKYTLSEDLKSGVENVAAVADAVTVKAVAGGIEVAAPEATVVAVYDLAGRVVAVVSVSADAPATVALPAGLYFAAGAKVAVY